MSYAIVDMKPFNVMIFKDKTSVASHLNVHVNTVTNWLSNDKVVFKKGVFIPNQVVLNKSMRGGKFNSF